MPTRTSTPPFAQFAPAGSVVTVALWPFVVAWGIAVLAGGCAWLMYAGAWRTAPARVARALPGLYRFVLDKFRVDELYDALVVRPVRGIAYWSWRLVDSVLIDGILVNGSARTVAFFGRAFRGIQNGDAQRYAALMALAAAVILFVVLGAGGR